ncbi:MAG TPA: FmdB family zinc ribbon protein [Dehalococcoidia bacterium]|nr:FmdB family zinc ribbon protein [Dehalococcoidia bacterium]
MPTYEYLCDAGHRYEKREGFDAPARQKCPSCGKAANRVIQAPPIVFKGSGFYKTDSRGSGAVDSAPSADASASSDTGSGDSSAEPAAAG